MDFEVSPLIEEPLLFPLLTEVPVEVLCSELEFSSYDPVVEPEVPLVFVVLLCFLVWVVLEVSLIVELPFLPLPIDVPVELPDLFLDPPC